MTYDEIEIALTNSGWFVSRRAKTVREYVRTGVSGRLVVRSEGILASGQITGLAKLVQPKEIIGVTPRWTLGQAPALLIALTLGAYGHDC